MILFAAVSPLGDIVGLGSCSEEDLANQAAPEGGLVVERPPEVSSPSLWSYTDGEFVGRDPVVPPVPLRTFTFNEWVDRFPFAAQVAIVTATATDPVAKLIYDRAMSAGMSGTIDPTDPRTVEGIEYLVSKEYITSADADQALGR